MKNKIGKQKHWGVGSGIVGGVMGAVLTTLLCMLVGTLCIQNEYLQITNWGRMVPVVQVLSTFVGAYMAGKLTDQKKLIAGIGGAGGWFILLLVISVAAFDGVGGRVFVGLISTVLGCGVGILAGNRDKKQASARKKKMSFR